jgi:hypothetical protein
MQEQADRQAPKSSLLQRVTFLPPAKQPAKENQMCEKRSDKAPYMTVREEKDYKRIT